MRNRIHGLNASKKEILSLGAQYFSPTVSSLSFGMFSDIGRKKIAIYYPAVFPYYGNEFSALWRKDIPVQAEEIRLLRFLMGCTSLRKVRNQTHRRWTSVYIQMLIKYRNKLIIKDGRYH